MENSMNSQSEALSSLQRTSESAEESGWTTYFDDFSLGNNNEHSHCSSGFESSSLVSDAASLAGKTSKSSHRGGSLSVVKSSKRLGFKKRKAAAAVVEDALEDTASSTVNIPEVYDLNEMDINAKLGDNADISQEKGSVSRQRDERTEVGLTGRDSDRTELKKRGLCLVPLSSIIHFLG